MLEQEPSREQSAEQKKIDAEALELVRVEKQSPGPNSRSAIERFANLSERHQEAITLARNFYSISSRYKRTNEKGLFERMSFSWHLFWLRFGQPHLLAPSVALLVLTVGIGLYLADSTDDTSLTMAEAKLELGQTLESYGRNQRSIQLEDGSEVWLGWNTKIQVSMTANIRSVKLDSGVAAFKVKSNPSRPFTVTAGSLTTQVVGTEFTVTRQRTDSVEVEVVEGEVLVAANDAVPIALRAEQVVTLKDGSLSPIGHRPAQQIGRWREGMLVFEKRPLLEALATLEPYTSFRLDTAAIASHNGMVTGVFFLDQADQGLFSILTAQGLDHHQDGSRLRLKRTEIKLQRPRFN